MLSGGVPGGMGVESAHPGPQASSAWMAYVVPPVPILRPMEADRPGTLLLLPTPPTRVPKNERMVGGPRETVSECSGAPNGRLTYDIASRGLDRDVDNEEPL